MTKTETLAMNNKIGFENDELFLLSIDEYKRYESVIKKIGSSCWWWLRSPGIDNDNIAYVYTDGSIMKSGFYVFSANVAIRPALKLPISLHYQIKDNKSLKIGERIIYKEFPFICVDENERLFIAEMPIGFHRFDEKSNNYATSEIRQCIKNWANNRL